MIANSSTTSADWLKTASAQLASKDIESARLDALIMLEECLGLSRASILSSDTTLSMRQLNKLTELLSRRLKYEPMAYIVKRAEFYGRSFYINNSVLIPRPESESFIELLKIINPKSGSFVLDVGTGSGCLGVSAKLELVDILVDLTDYSQKALNVAKKNADFLGARVEIIKGDLLKSALNQYDIILANLPYIPTNYKLDRSTAFEPRLALIGGNNGLDLYKRFWKEIKALKHKPSLVLTESLSFQHQDLELLANSSEYYLDRTEGLVQQYVRSVG